MYESPNLLLDMMENRWVANPSDESTTDEMIGQGLLPVQGRITSAMQAEPQASKEVGMRLWVLRRQLYIETPGALGVEVRPGYIVDHYVIPALTFLHRGGSAD